MGLYVHGLNAVVGWGKAYGWGGGEIQAVGGSVESAWGWQWTTYMYHLYITWILFQMQSSPRSLYNLALSQDKLYYSPAYFKAVLHD